jgi:hypothetical protein
MSILIVQTPLDPFEEANTMISLADARTRAAELGVVLPTDDIAAETALIVGNDYLFGLAFCGYPTNDLQGTAFPRAELYLGDTLYDANATPQAVIDAQIYVASVSVSTSLYGVNDGKELKRKNTAGAIEKEYFQTGNSSTKKHIERVDAMLAKFLTGSSGSFMIPVVC